MECKETKYTVTMLTIKCQTILKVLLAERKLPLGLKISYLKIMFLKSEEKKVFPPKHNKIIV